jgi:hypothetical protein
MENQSTTSQEELNDLYKANQQNPETANKIAVDTGIQVIKSYKDTGYLSWDGAAILAACGTVLVANTITNIVNLVRIGNTVSRNAITYLTESHFKETEYIEGILRDLLTASDSDRVCLGVLHNGERWGSKHFTKMTVAYETRKSGIASVKPVFKAVDIEKISEELRIATHTEFISFKRSDLGLSSGCKIYLDTVGIKSVSTRLLRSKEGVYAILELQKLSESESVKDDSKSQKLEEIYNRLSWAMDRVRKGKKLYK